MRIVLSIAVVLACLSLAYGGNCQSSGDCCHVTCPENDWIVGCSQGQCTSNHPTASCSSAQECHHILHGCHRDLHCVDGQCACIHLVVPADQEAHYRFPCFCFYRKTLF